MPRPATPPRMSAAPVVVLDDDPTGTQLVDRARVLLTWSTGAIREAAASGARSVHLITNSRALDAKQAYAVTLDAARAARAALPESTIVMRGDSTLRGHVRPEYEALRDGALGGRDAPLLLALALPSAGRITLNGVHLLERDGLSVPLHETEYARDPAFGYADARLLAWAESATGGLLPASRGREVSLEELRSVGPESVSRALAELSDSAPAACVVDAESWADLVMTAEGLNALQAAGGKAAVRCSPALTAVLGNNLAPITKFIPPGSGRGVLVVCGSYVPTTTRQIRALAEVWPHAIVEADVLALASTRPGPEQGRLAAELRARLDGDGVAVLATSRTFEPAVSGQSGRYLLARELAGVLARLDPWPAVVIAKGGVTSAITLQHGLGAHTADVVGPVALGVSAWRPLGTRTDPPTYVVVPGNVGGDELLSTLVADAMTSSENVDDPSL